MFSIGNEPSRETKAEQRQAYAEQLRQQVRLHEQPRKKMSFSNKIGIAL